MTKSMKTRILGLAGAAAALPLLAASPAQAGHGGDYCREYTRAVWIGGHQRDAYGTACLRPDGAWEIVAEALVRAIGVPAYHDYPVRTVREVRYVDRAYHPPQIVFIDRHRDHHPGLHRGHHKRHWKDDHTYKGKYRGHRGHRGHRDHQRHDRHDRNHR